MLRLLVSMSMVFLVSGSVLADGVERTSRKTAAVSLPAAQPSVAVTVERGVRVWRPLGTDGGVETGYPQFVTLGPAGGTIAVPVYGGGAGGLFTGFGGGYGKGYGRKALAGACRRGRVWLWLQAYESRSRMGTCWSRSQTHGLRWTRRAWRQTAWAWSSLRSTSQAS